MQSSFPFISLKEEGLTITSWLWSSDSFFSSERNNVVHFWSILLFWPPTKFSIQTKKTLVSLIW